MNIEHKGTVSERLDRLETAVASLAKEVGELSENSRNRRATDEVRLRRLEDTMLVWDTRWKTVTAGAVAIFGTSIATLILGIIGLIK